GNGGGGLIVITYTLSATAAVVLQDAELPPSLGRGTTADLRTAFAPGYVAHGAASGAQSADLPPFGRGPPADLRTAVLAGQFGLPQGAQSADLPPLGR